VRQRRPALVLAAGALARNHGLLWVAMITSAANRAWPGDVAIADLARAGLPAPSLIRTAKLATIEVSDALRLGRLPRVACRAVSAHLRSTLAAALELISKPAPPRH
jgi:mRNA interferase MazF